MTLPSVYAHKDMEVTTMSNVKNVKYLFANIAKILMKFNAQYVYKVLICQLIKLNVLALLKQGCLLIILVSLAKFKIVTFAPILQSKIFAFNANRI